MFKPSILALVFLINLVEYGEPSPNPPLIIRDPPSTCPYATYKCPKGWNKIGGII